VREKKNSYWVAVIRYGFATVGVLALVAFFLCGLALTDRKIDGWRGLVVAAWLIVSDKQAVCVDREPLRYMTEGNHISALEGIEGVEIVSPNCGHHGEVTLNGQAYKVESGAFTHRYTIWTLEPVDTP